MLIGLKTNESVDASDVGCPEEETSAAAGDAVDKGERGAAAADSDQDQVVSASRRFWPSE